MVLATESKPMIPSITGNYNTRRAFIHPVVGDSLNQPTAAPEERSTLNYESSSTGASI